MCGEHEKTEKRKNIRKRDKGKGGGRMEIKEEKINIKTDKYEWKQARNWLYVHKRSTSEKY